MPPLELGESNDASLGAFLGFGRLCRLASLLAGSAKAEKVEVRSEVSKCWCGCCKDIAFTQSFRNILIEMEMYDLKDKVEVIILE